MNIIPSDAIVRTPPYVQTANSQGAYFIVNIITFALIAVYLFIYLYACYSHNKKSFKPNRMTFGGMIVYYPGTI